LGFSGHCVVLRAVRLVCRACCVRLFDIDKTIIRGLSYHFIKNRLK
jgi:hypothetical protein